MQFGTVEMSGSLSATQAEQEAVFKIFDASWKMQWLVYKKLVGQCYYEKILFYSCAI